MPRVTAWPGNNGDTDVQTRDCARFKSTGGFGVASRVSQGLLEEFTGLEARFEPFEPFAGVARHRRQYGCQVKCSSDSIAQIQEFFPAREVWMQNGTSGLMGKRNNLVFGLAILVLVVLYAGVFIARPDQLFADDSYFYLQVAWNFARGMGSTFNTLMPTNGYHPLWMLLCAAVYKVLPSRIPGMH